MEVGVVRVAEDRDFLNLKELLDSHADWKLDFCKGPLKVWTKMLPNTNFKMIKVLALFPEVSPEVMYDVLHDPEYRKVWDQHMIESHDIGFLNPNNDVGYYSMSCPSPLANRDFVLQRSWLDLGKEKYILNHSVYHVNYPPKKGFIRATSYLTGFLVRELDNGGCNLGYISQTDPRGTLPPWLVNRVTQIFGPKMVKSLQKATLGYLEWKCKNQPYLKPWHFPEQIRSTRLNIDECVMSPAEKKHKSCEEEESKPLTPTKPKLTDILSKPKLSDLSLKPKLTDSPSKSKLTDSPSKSKDSPSKSKLTDPPSKSKLTDPPSKSKLTDPPSKSKLTDPPSKSKLTDPLSKSKLSDSPSKSKITDSPSSSPESTSKSSGSPSFKKRSLKLFKSSKH